MKFYNFVILKSAGNGHYTSIFSNLFLNISYLYDQLKFVNIISDFLIFFDILYVIIIHGCLITNCIDLYVKFNALHLNRTTSSI